MTAAARNYGLFKVGDVAIVTFTVLDNDPRSGTYLQKIDPSVVGFNWGPANGSTTTRWVYGQDSGIQRYATGVYEAYIPCTRPGSFDFRPWSDQQSGQHPGAEEGRITVQGSRIL